MKGMNTKKNSVETEEIACCTFPECERTSKDCDLVRGLCPTHHTTIFRRIRAAEKDGHDRVEVEADLMNQGILLPSDQGSRTDLGKVAQKAVVDAIFRKFPAKK